MAQQRELAACEIEAAERPYHFEVDRDPARPQLRPDPVRLDRCDLTDRELRGTGGLASDFDRRSAFRIRGNRRFRRTDPRPAGRSRPNERYLRG